MKFTLALVAAVSANRYENMNEDELLVNLESTLVSAQQSQNPTNLRNIAYVLPIFIINGIRLNFL